MSASLNAGSLNLSEQVIHDALIAWLGGVVPSGMPIIRTQVNRAPTPDQDYIAITPITRKRMAFNLTNYQDQGAAGGAQFISDPTEYRLQVDAYGAQSQEIAQAVAMLWRHESACAFFADYVIPGQSQPSLSLAPLYASEPKQLPFLDGQDAWLWRWSVDLLMQVNFTLTLTQQFADALKADLISVDAVYPPS